MFCSIAFSYQALDLEQHIHLQLSLENYANTVIVGNKFTGEDRFLRVN